MATPGDLLVHIRAHRFDLCFELAQRLTDRLAGAAQVVDEVHGFRSFDERDLLGFVDGTENPEGRRAGARRLIGDEDPAFAGGSYVVVQKYLHDLRRWNALPVEEQERAIGRTKLSDLELPDDVKPANSHVALNTIVGEDGEERQIVRFNMPFGARRRRRVRHLLHRLRRRPRRDRADADEHVRRNAAGHHDRILDFSTAVTGSLFFVPSAGFLDDPPGDAPGDAGAVQPGSLGIGSLKGDSS